jgi:hypothetical protein
MAPVLFEAKQPPVQQFEVLSTKGAESAPFIVRVQLDAPLERAEIERAIATSIGSAAAPAYRIEQRSPSEYAVVFERKPSVEVAGQMLTQLGGTPNVASATIDDGSAQQ